MTHYIDKMAFGNSRRRRSVAVLAATLTATALIAAGCGGSSSGSGSSPSSSASAPSGGLTGATKTRPAPSDGVITVAAQEPPDSLDPQYGVSGTDYQFLHPLYDTLVDVNPETLAATPGLATSWKFVTPTTFVMQLRTGVTFQDGTPFNAAAVVYSIGRYQKAGDQSDLSVVTHVTAQGNSQVTLTLAHPDYILPSILSDRGGMIVSPTAAKKEGPKGFGLHPVGTGPYSFVSFSPTAGLVLKPYAGYWGTKNTTVKELSFKFITNTSTTTNGLLSGTISYADNLDFSDIATLKKAGLAVDVEPTTHFQMFYINLKQAPLKNQLVRQAFNYAIDRNALVKAVQEGYGEPAWLPAQGTSSTTPSFPYNPTKAKQLLAQAGYPHGVTITAGTYPVTGSSTEIAIIKAELQQVGINLKVTLQAISALGDFFLKGTYNAELGGWTGAPAPALTYAELFPAGVFENAGHVNIPGFDAAVTALEGAKTPAAQQVQIAKLNSILNTFAPYVPLYYTPNVTAYQSYVKGDYPDVLGQNIALKQVTLG